MITYTKASKLDKVDTKFFTILKVSMEREDEGEVSLPYILPPASLLIPRKQGDMSKKKFAKRYKKYLETNKGAELATFNILKSLKSKRSICFTCTDDEYELGYVQVLTDYLAGKFGVEVLSLKDANATLKNELSSLEKKHRKLIYKDDEEIGSSKKIKMRDKLTNNILKLIKSDLSEEGNDLFNTLDKKFAVEQIIWASIDSGACTYKKNAIANIDEDKILKVKPYVMAIMLTAENDKTYRSIVKSVLSANSLKLKEKQLKKLSKTQIVSLCGEIVRKINEYRENETFED